MSNNPKPAFSWWKFMLVAVLSGAVLWAANAGAQAALKAWADSQVTGCFIFCGWQLLFLGAELAIIVLNGLALGVFIVRLRRLRTASRWGMVTGFGGFVLVTGAT